MQKHTPNPWRLLRQQKRINKNLFDCIAVHNALDNRNNIKLIEKDVAISQLRAEINKLKIEGLQRSIEFQTLNGFNQFLIDKLCGSNPLAVSALFEEYKATRNN